ncbi:MAG: hypothetical protein ACXWLL_02880, partial [Myxococcaceae bacterium]
RRVLWVVGVAGAFLLLVMLGASVAALLSPGESSRPEPEPVRRAPLPPPVPPPPPSPSPAPARLPDPPPPPPTPAPAPVPAEPRPVSVDAGAIPLTDRLRIRRELIRGVTALKGELSGCPVTPVRPSPDGRAALVLDLLGVGNGARVVGTTLEADIPVNDRFVACVSGVLQGRTLPATGVSPGARLRFFIPLGLAGNTLGLSSASLVDSEDVAPR